jgi:signal transduction histidine kinase
MFDDGPPILEYLQQLGEAQAQLSVETVLRQMANHFDASGIGVTYLDNSKCDVAFASSNVTIPSFPWKTDSGMIQRLGNPFGSLEHQDDGGQWLISSSGDTREEAPLAWVYRPGKDGWKKRDSLLWPLAGQTLVRYVSLSANSGVSPVTLSNRLEQAALVTSRLSHDFGNYLTGIMGFTELSIQQAPAGGLLHRYLNEVLLAARQGSEWIRRLHWFCRRSGKYAWPAELDSVLAEIQRNVAEDANQRWEKRVPRDLPLLAIDALSLQAAITELANNAREATRDFPKLTIVARAADLTENDCRILLGTPRPGKYVEITISDDGAGFSNEARGRIFHEPFYSSKPRHRGLGLLLVYGIMHRFHGGLSLGAAADANGASVRLLVPAATIDTPAAVVNAPHVLVVHPDPLLFESLRKVLELQGCRVSVALTAQTAINVYQTPGHDFALVLADAILPQLSGFGVARRILERDPRANFLFLYTQSSFHGVSDDDLLKRFKLLRWPVDTALFVQTVRESLGIPSSEPEKPSP